MTSPRAGSHTGTSSSFQSSNTSSKRRVLVIFGTRPEAIKLCPVIAALRSDIEAKSLHVAVCVTGQHREMLHQVLDTFNIQPDYDLEVMSSGQTLSSLYAKLIGALPSVLDIVKPSLTLVQGDTASTFCGALSSFFAGVPVAHIEAGLRTFDLQSPFPEEMNRLITGRLANLHFAATQGAANNLLREGVAAESIKVTGNTGIDALLSVRDRLVAGKLPGLRLHFDDSKKLIVVTAHRRESFGEGLLNICRAISRLAARGDVEIVWPVHRNPNVQQTVHATLRDKPNVILIEPLEYVPFIDLMRRAYLLITDSGGIQEEGPSLGKPILVLRDITERPEAVEAGTVKLVGTSEDAIVAQAVRLLESEEAYRSMARLHNPYGDGQASSRIVRRVAHYLDSDQAAPLLPNAQS